MSRKRIKHSKKKGMAIKTGFFVYLAFCLFSTVWLRAAVVNLEYEIGDLNELKSELLSEKKMALAQRASSYSLKKIEHTAIKRLGMTLPERENVYFVKRAKAAAPYKASMK